MYHKQIVREAMGENLRLDQQSNRNTINSKNNGLSSAKQPQTLSIKKYTANGPSSAQKASLGGSDAGDNTNMFKKRVGSGRGSASVRSIASLSDKNSLAGRHTFSKEENEFENECLEIIKQGQNWENLEQRACDQLDKQKGKSAKGFFFLGVALFKLQYYDGCIKAYSQSNELNSKDPQLHYNLGLAYFKAEQYTKAVEHLKICTTLDPINVFAYNNLAFIYNMHQYYQETINVCNTAKLMLEQYEKMMQQEKIDSLFGMRGSRHSKQDPDELQVNHKCHRHWAFALYKKGDMGKACKMIKQAVELEPKDADNWITWGLIMLKVGNYKISKHKFIKALKLDPENEVAKKELELLENIMELDS